MRSHVLSALAAVVLAAGCASSPGGTSATLAPRREPNYIGHAELTDPSVQSLNAYDAVTRLRPNFFRNRGPSSISAESQYQLKVRVDDTLMGGVEALRDIPVYEVEDIRFLPPSEAVPKYGTEYPGGVIVVRRHH